jgi:ferredoxin
VSETAENAASGEREGRHGGRDRRNIEVESAHVAANQRENLMKVWIDPSKCRGHALCLTHAPDAFEFIDLEDRAVVKEGADKTVSVDVFLAAARECPEQAIIVELD